MLDLTKEGMTIDLLAPARQRVWSFLEAPSRESGGGVCFWRVEMTTKGVKERLKHDKLTKTKGRREALARGRRVAEIASSTRRNDLLPPLVICQIPIVELTPRSRRVRKTEGEQVETIARSMAEYGFRDPVLVRGGVVLDGWSRVLAAKSIGIETVPVISCDDLGDAQARALALALNRISERGTWDLDELRIEFLELIELEVDLDATGFTSQEQDIILLDPLEGEQDDGADDTPEPPTEPITQLGDVWDLKDHRMICGSSLDEETYRTLLQGEAIHAVLTDPPFNVKIQGNVSGLGKKVHEEFAMASGEMSDAEFETFLAAFLALVKSVVLPGAVIFCFMDWRGIAILYAAAKKAGLTLINLAVWYKQSGGMGGLYRSAHELVSVFCNGDTPACNNVRLGANGRNRCNVWEAPGANRRGSSANEMLGSHATPKPTELCVDAILDVTQLGDIVLDAFLGSGTTLIAAEKSGRRCRGIELEPRFVDVAVLRWEKFTGQRAVLAETGESFAEVAERRSVTSSSQSQTSEGDGQ